jgi:predicted amidohydrolase
MKNSFARVLSCVVFLILCSSAFADDALQPIQEVFSPTGNYDPTKFGKVAVIQWNPASTPMGVTADQAEAFKQGNRQELEGYIRQAAGNGAEWIITSEFAVDGYPDIVDLPPAESDYRDRADIAPYVETVPGISTQFFSALASELHVSLNIGLAEVDPATQKYYNTVVVIDGSGQIVAKYHKINLFELETKFLSPGESITVYQNQFGKVGILLCADVYSSDPVGQYAQAGVNVLALSTSWVEMNTGMQTFAQTATQVGSYLLAANQMYYPDSGVINPDGSYQSHIRQSEGIAYGYLPYVK